MKVWCREGVSASDNRDCKNAGLFSIYIAPEDTPDKKPSDHDRCRDGISGDENGMIFLEDSPSLVNANSIRRGGIFLETDSNQAIFTSSSII